MFDYSSASTLNAVFSPENLIMLASMAVVNLVLMNYLGRKFMQIIQQSGYVYADYVKWVRRRDNVYVTRLYMIVMLSVLAYLVFSIALSFANVNYVAPIAFVFYGLFAFLYIRSDLKRKSKHPLAFTARLLRVYITYSVLFFVFGMALLVLCALLGYYIKENDILFRVRYCVICVSPLMVPPFTAAANFINSPAERANNKKYIEKCRLALAERNDLIKIGITGSYGKTSVKEILSTILSEKYNVLATPLSYNTPLGIARAVKMLNDSHDVFIAEMGARHEGDIKELSDIVRPDYAVINGIIEHHMDTFSSLEQIVKTKFEIVDGMDGGTLVLTADNEQTLSMVNAFENVKTVVAGLDLSAKPHVYATDIEVGAEGSEFTLNVGEKSRRCSTCLLGEHNISNVTLAAAVADALGMTIDEICAGIARVKPIKHRLESSVNDAGVTIIDDSYNSNVSGTKAAVKVLAGFCGRKIVVTPGMVELGRMEDRENFDLGRRLAAVADYVILVDNRGAFKIRDGLLTEGFPLEKIFMAKNLGEAVAHFKKISKKGDVVLFENDLPDKFS